MLLEQLTGDVPTDRHCRLCNASRYLAWLQIRPPYPMLRIASRMLGHHLLENPVQSKRTQRLALAPATSLAHARTFWIRWLVKIGKAMVNRLGIDAEQIGNIFHSAIPQLSTSTAAYRRRSFSDKDRYNVFIRLSISSL